MIVCFFFCSITLGTTENIFVFLFGEINVIESVWMWIYSWVISIVLPSRVRSHIVWMAKSPVFDFTVTYWSSLVVITYCHCSFIGLVVNSLSSQEPLSLFSQSLKNMIWANFHDWDFLVQAIVSSIGTCTSIVLSNFSIATSWNHIGFQDHVFRLHHIWLNLTTIFMTQSLSFSIWEPVVMSLDMSMIFVEWIIQVTINPWKLRNVTKVHWHLCNFTWLMLVHLSQRIKFLIQVWVNNHVTPIVVGFCWTFMLNPLSRSWGIEIIHWHF